MIIEPITRQLKGLRIVSSIRTTSKTCSSYIVFPSSEIMIPLPGAQTKTRGVYIVNGGKSHLSGLCGSICHVHRNCTGRHMELIKGFITLRSYRGRHSTPHGAIQEGARPSRWGAKRMRTHGQAPLLGVMVENTVDPWTTCVWTAWVHSCGFFQ